MLIYTKTADIQAFCRHNIEQGKLIGLVPTMGALHAGHVSLINISKRLCDITICSIFVNPTQFNDVRDLQNYPRDLASDTVILQTAGCDVLFAPAEEEVYSTGREFSFNFGNLDKILEGKYRPGHFKGVAQVVSRFFDIIKPDKAFFGSKDYQQLLVVKMLAKRLNSNVEIIPCPIVRDASGLAMSSRNRLLSSDELNAAESIPLIEAGAWNIAVTAGITEAKAFVASELKKNALLRPEYYEICDAGTLESLDRLKTGMNVIALIAVYSGKIRLIDNWGVREIV